MKKSMNTYVVVLPYSPTRFVTTSCANLFELEFLVKRKRKCRIT